MTTKVVCISDTHTKHKTVKIPECDILIHSGDFFECVYGEMRAIELARDFFKWISMQPAKEIILISGNHDIYMDPKSTSKGMYEYMMKLLENYPKIKYLHNESHTTHTGHTVWGSPYVPVFGNWAFMVQETELWEMYKDIPEDVDILITHGPAFEYCDMTYRGVRAGSTALAAKLKDLTNLKLHVFGHIHEGAGVRTSYNENGSYTYHVNASVVNRNLNPTNTPIVLEI